MTRMRSLYLTLFVSSAMGVASANEARAQAWVPSQGEGTVAVAFQSMNVKYHLAATTRVDAGTINTNVLLADMSYGLTDKIAVDLAMPFVSSKYNGSRPHPGTNIDDGAYRGSFTDFRFSMRYNLTRSGAVITPYIGSVVPSHSYASYGHAAPGQRLREIQVGVYTAKMLERGIPGLFVSGRYGYGFVEKVLDISHNRSSGDLEVGYFITPSLRAFAMANGQYSHGGIDLPINGLAGLAPEFRPVHDRIQRVHVLDVGAGAAYSITDTFDVFGNYSRIAAGRNGHALNRGITVGGSWSFKKKSRAGDTITAAAPASDTPDAVVAKKEGSLLRCICQKSGS
jgi:hypothetical protein